MKVLILSPFPVLNLITIKKYAISIAPYLTNGLGSDTKVILVKKCKNITIAGPEDLKDCRIGVVKDDSAVQFVSE